jgi:hypothetical protein
MLHIHPEGLQCSSADLSAAQQAHQRNGSVRRSTSAPVVTGRVH